MYRTCVKACVTAGLGFAWVAAAPVLDPAAGRAEAFCWSSTSKPDGFVCEPATPIDRGMPLSWRRECVGYSLQIEGTSQLSPEKVSKAVAGAYNVWLQPFCRGQSPGIGLKDLPSVACGNVEYNSLAGNANIVVFRDREWFHESGQLALTTATFDPKTGEIYDVDIEVNTADFEFSVDDVEVHYDLQSIMAHEVGHFWGMGHSFDDGSTMFPSYDGNSIEERTLTKDDQAGMCAMYPPLPIDLRSCNPIPRHGFAVACQEEQPDHGCSVRRIGDGRGGDGWVVLVALGWLLRRQLGTGPRKVQPRRVRGKRTK